MITSIKNPKIQLVRQLLNAKKHRDKENLIVLEGVRLAEEALASGIAIEICYFSDSLTNRGRELIAEITSKGVETQEIEKGLLDRISDTQTSQGILLVCAAPACAFPAAPDFILVLDRISDPGNLGTIMRTASGLGVDGVFLTPGSTDPFAPKALRAGLGAQLHMPLRWALPHDVQEYCNQISPSPQILISTMDCDNNCWEMDLAGPTCLVIGSEAEGVSNEIRQIADNCVSIPIISNLESYNAAVAAGILLYEVSRQRKMK